MSSIGLDAQLMLRAESQTSTTAAAAATGTKLGGESRFRGGGRTVAVAGGYPFNNKTAKKDISACPRSPASSDGFIEDLSSFLALMTDDGQPYGSSDARHHVAVGKVAGGATAVTETNPITLQTAGK